MVLFFFLPYLFQAIFENTIYWYKAVGDLQCTLTCWYETWLDKRQTWVIFFHASLQSWFPLHPCNHDFILVVGAHDYGGVRLLRGNSAARRECLNYPKKGQISISYYCNLESRSLISFLKPNHLNMENNYVHLVSAIYCYIFSSETLMS